MATRPVEDGRIEPRWPVACAILTVILLIADLPGRIRLLPGWLPFVAMAAFMVPLVGVMVSAHKAPWLRLERRVTLLLSIIVTLGIIGNLAILLFVMLNRSQMISGQQLLASSVGVWGTNVLASSLIYWQLDRGGPAIRVGGAGPQPDWLFPQEGAPSDDVRPDWRPVYVDYLFLAFSTATAFSTTDVVPLTARAKLLMMLEAAISLVTLVLVASRAINILGA